LSIVAWLGFLLGGGLAICSDWDTDAECSSKQHEGIISGTFMSVLLGAIALGLLFLLIRAIGRPRLPPQRVYLVSALAIGLAPTVILVASFTIGLKVSTIVGVYVAVVLMCVVPPAWALMVRRFAARELRRA